jgi:hypothetical protein
VAYYGSLGYPKAFEETFHEIGVVAYGPARRRLVAPAETGEIRRHDAKGAGQAVQKTQKRQVVRTPAVKENHGVPGAAVVAIYIHAVYLNHISPTDRMFIRAPALPRRFDANYSTSAASRSLPDARAY